jgi:trehalose 6-phosphate phosphatase
VEGTTAMQAPNGGSLPSALDRFERLTAELGGRRPMIFLDYDGTLTPIVDRPDAATLAPAMRATLARIAGLTTLAIVSGRDVETLRGFVGLDGIAYAGDHGFDIRRPDGAETRNDAAEPFLDRFDALDTEIRDRLSGIAGVIVERKRFSVAVHYRLATAADREAVHDLIDEIVRREAGLRVTPGKMVLELQPDIAWDKGRAVTHLLAALGREEPSVPLYIGDDITDEDAFRVLRSRGIGILVGAPARGSWARYRLADPDEVGRFLDRLAERMDA